LCFICAKKTARWALKQRILKKTTDDYFEQDLKVLREFVFFQVSIQSLSHGLHALYQQKRSKAGPEITFSPFLSFTFSFFYFKDFTTRNKNKYTVKFLIDWETKILALLLTSTLFVCFYGKANSLAILTKF